MEWLNLFGLYYKSCAENNLGPPQILVDIKDKNNLNVNNLISCRIS